MSKKNESNDNKRFYPLRDPENPSKVTLVPITEEQYRALYPDIWATQKREQYHGRCMCPRCYLWKCDGQCDLCEYHAPDTTSLDEPLPDGNGTLGDYIPDSKPSIEDIYADRDLLKRLLARFRELDECRARAEANLKLAQHDFKLPPLLTDTEVEVILGKVDELVSWASDIKEFPGTGLRLG